MAARAPFSEETALLKPTFAKARCRLDVAALLLLAGVVWIWRLGANGLFDLDEGLYVAAAREMLLSGDWVTPRVNGVPFYDKPPLMYWAVAGSFQVFGEDEFAARLPSALAATALVLLVYFLGRRIFGRPAGFLAAVMLVLSPLMGMVARQMMLDALLCLWVAVALTGWFLGYTATTERGRRWYLLLWAGASLGVMTKGLPGVVLPALVVAVTLLVAERFRPQAFFRRLAELRWLAGLPLFLLIAAPWHLLAWAASPLTGEGGNQFFQQYVVYHHLQRFQGAAFEHNLPSWFFVPVLLAGFFPWSAYLVCALARRDDAGDARESRLARLLLRFWVGVVFAVFSIGVSKCEVYILPLFPAAALLTGEWCARAVRDARLSRALQTSTAAISVLAVAGIAAVLVSGALLEREGVPPELLRCAVCTLTAVALAAGAAAVLQARAQPAASPRALVAGCIVAGVIAVSDGLRAVDRSLLAPVQTLARKGARLAQAEGAAIAIEAVRPRRPSALFYLPDSLAYRSALPVRENQGAQGSPLQTPLIDFLRAHPRAYLVIDDERARSLTAQLHLERVAGGRGWLLLRRIPVRRAPEAAAGTHVAPRRKAQIARNQGAIALPVRSSRRPQGSRRPAGQR